MDDFDDDGNETLTFVDDDDDHHAATQDSQFDYGTKFLSTQESQPVEPSIPIDDGLMVDEESQLEFEEVEDEEEEGESTDEESSTNMNYSGRKIACKYCGINDPKCVMKCKFCDKWFCNSRSGLGNKSHIVHHLVKAKHNEVTTDPNHPLGVINLSCYNCETKNVFNLGFIPAKAETLVMIICRNGCLHGAQKKESDYDGDKWEPLLSENQFLKWIVEEPSAELEESAQPIDLTMARKLEDAWRRMPDATKEDLERPDADVALINAKLSYASAVEYCDILTPLVQEEMQSERETKEAESQNVGHVTWFQGLHSNWTASFQLPMFADGSMKVVLGDQLRLSHTQTVDGSEWSCIGKVTKIPDNHTQRISITTLEEIDKSVTLNSKLIYVCTPIWNATTFLRQKNALKAIASNPTSCMSSYIFKKLMGQPVDDAVFKVQLPKKWSVPGLPELNHVQMRVLENVLIRPLSLIQGPPGTGKTGTSASIVYHMSKVMRNQILVCSPSNIATDELAHRINLTGLKVVRVYSTNREGLEGKEQNNPLGLQAQLLRLTSASELQKLITLKNEFGELSLKDHKRLEKLSTYYGRQIIMNAEVVCCTCSTAADSRISEFNFKYVVIDESTQATEPEVLVALTSGVKQVILVGDHCQLGPVVMSKKAERAGLQQSLFERLIQLGNKPYRLEIQYRMHPTLSEFPSNMFYEGSLQNGVSENDRIMSSMPSWPVPNKPTFFWYCMGNEEVAANGTSYLNRTEAVCVEKLTTMLMKANVNPEQIGIITPYEGQRSYIVNYMKTQGILNSQFYDKLEIANVDAFQGREKDIIILTCVRSNANVGIGFLKDPRRLNVAITRAKYGLFIIGNGQVLSRNCMWNALLTWYKKKELIYVGPIINLRRTDPNIEEPIPSQRTRETMGNSQKSRNSAPANNGRLVKGPVFQDDENSALPIPTHMFGAPVFNKAVPPPSTNGRRHKPSPVVVDQMLSQGDFASQASQDFLAADGTSSYMDHPLSGWSSSQSQSQGGGRRSQLESQDDMGGLDRIEDLLASQGN